MRVLLIDGFRSGEDRAGVVELSSRRLVDRGHSVAVIGLEVDGFETFMTAAERRAYHQEDNLLTDQTKRSAAAVRSTDALLLCCPLVQGSIPPLVKSWFERVFVPEVSFTFTRSGRVTGALGHVRRVGIVLSCPDGDPVPHRRDGPARSLVRLTWLSGPRRRRITYAPIMPGQDPAEQVATALARW